MYFYLDTINIKRIAQLPSMVLQRPNIALAMNMHCILNVFLGPQSAASSGKNAQSFCNR